MAEKRLIDASPENAKSVLGDYPYYPDEIWKFAAMAERFPTVDAVEVVHGHWIKEIDNSTHMHKCSVCGARVVKGLYEYDNPNIYCYHCGAKMDGDMENYRPAEVIR